MEDLITILYIEEGQVIIMMVEICVGSSCHLKGSEQIVRMMQEAVASHGLDNDISLAGMFCSGKCNRTGVTIAVDDELYPGITPESFPEFFAEKIEKPIREERA